MNKTKNKITSGFLLLGDFLLFYWSLYLALFLRKMSLPDVNVFNDLQEPFLYLFFIWAFIFFTLDFYEISLIRKSISFLRGVIVFTLLATATGTVYFYFQPQLELAPRAILFLTVVNFVILSSLWRFLFFRIIGLKNFRKNIFFVGFCDEIKEVIEKGAFDYDVLGIYTKENVSQEIKKNVDVFDTFEKVKEVSKKIEILVFTSDIKEDKKTIKKIFSSFPLDVKYMEFFNLYEEVTKKAPLHSLNEWWLLENVSRPKNKLNETAKRSFEIFTSFLGLVLLFPLFFLITLFIKIDSPGSVFYKQKRTGEKGKKFVLYKFRTMHDNPQNRDVPWREKDKNEITKFGKVLRKTHLDEIPQLYNILRGDISFVGPRPEITSLAKRFEENIPFYKLRYLVRPGLTGWAQINYPPSKNIKQAEEKFKYDLYYIKNRSFFFDIVIILKTLKTIF
jgi:exopolysaccharide biosynthesis polyprenyl glycosylphosphotransferase